MAESIARILSPLLNFIQLQVELPAHNTVSHLLTEVRGHEGLRKRKMGKGQPVCGMVCGAPLLVSEGLDLVARSGKRPQQ
jgi:hypothetical protein